MYHSIKSVEKAEIMRSLHVHPSNFILQMHILKMLGYRGCSLSEAYEALRTRSKKKLVALTFDDGYKNFQTAVLPVLKDLNFSATVYIVADLVGSYNVWDEQVGISRNELMGWQDLEECVANGIEIGCHSMTHASLCDADIKLTQEIINSKKLIEQNLNIRVNSFCYPYGHYNPEIVQQLKTAGFSNACTMVRSRISLYDDPFLLPRIPITWHTLPHLFLMKLFTSYEDKRRHK